MFCSCDSKQSRTPKIQHQESKQSMPYILTQNMLRQLTVLPSLSCGLAAVLFWRHTFQAGVMDRAQSKTGPFTQYNHSFTLRSFQWELHWFHWYETVPSVIFNLSEWQKEERRNICSPHNFIIEILVLKIAKWLRNYIQGADK